MNRSWQKLIQEAAEGQPSALQQLVAKYDSVIRRSLQAMTTPPHLSSRDLSQEVWLRVILKLHTFEGRDDESDHVFRSWLRVTARRVAFSILRKKNVTASQSLTSDLSSRGLSPGSRARRAELRAAVLQALAALPNPGDADVVLMRYVDQLTLDQIAARSGLTKDQVRHALKRAELQLQRLLGDLTD